MQTLRLGSRGPDVELLQLALQRAQYFEGTIDGVFGAATQRAVINFQSDYGLTADGIVGPATWSALNHYLTGYIEHYIRQGDTFFSLARQYGTTISAITVANPNIPPTGMIPGMRMVIPLGFNVVPTNISFTYSLLELCIEGLRARYPFIRQQAIGSSILGKPLHALAIGRGQNEVMYNASHQAIVTVLHFVF